MPAAALAIDLGGTNLRCALVDERGSIVFEARESTQAEQGVDAVINRIARMILHVASETGSGPDIEVGVAAPGPLDPRQGIVMFMPNLPGWYDVPLRERLEALVGRRVHLGNDANAAALGEFYFGAGRDVENLVYLGLGTGVGGGVVSEGRLIDGARGMGGELGHVTVSMDGPRCSCGSSGCIESYCSGWALARDAQALVESDRSPGIATAAKGGVPDARAVSAAARAGDPEAQALLERAGMALGAGLGGFINTFNPELIVIGGGLSRIGDPLLNPARRGARAFAFPALSESLPIERTELDGRAGIFGAAALVFYAGAQ